MRGLRLGLTLGNRGGAAQIITATINPAMSPLYDGQAVEDVTNWSTFNNTSNYASTEGTISTATPAYTGDASAADDALSEDETAGFTITVADDQANERVFTAAQIIVQYKVNLGETDGNEVEIDINPLVGDAVALGDIVISGAAAYNGTYTGITAGDIRNGPYCWGDSNSVGLPTISGTIGVGETLTVDEGLWSTPEGTTLTFSYQWQRDGGDISGATSATYDIVMADQGTDLTCEVTGDDGVNSPVTAETAATAIPSGSAAVINQIGATVTSTANGSTAINQSVNLGASKAGKEAVLELIYGDSGSADDQYPVATLDSSSPDTNIVQLNKLREGIVVYAWDASAGGTVTLNVERPPSDLWRGYTYRVWTVEDHSSIFAGTTDNDTGTTALDLDTAVQSGDVLFGLAAMGNTGTGNFSLAGIAEDETYTTPDILSPRRASFLGVTADATETRTITVTPPGDASGVNIGAIWGVRA